MQDMCTVQNDQICGAELIRPSLIRQTAAGESIPLNLQSPCCVVAGAVTCCPRWWNGSWKNSSHGAWRMGEKETLCSSLKHTHAYARVHTCVCVCMYTQIRHMETAVLFRKQPKWPERNQLQHSKSGSLPKCLILGNLGLLLHLEISLHGTPATPSASIL